ncbi:MAG: hypothetical protein IJW47_03675 [Clostridia bacterium]|nr:hypothetical protein [Clostridia bacterium]
MIKDENYFVVHGWMRTKLNLKGNYLTIYALVYGFSQDGESEFRGSLDYIKEFTGGSDSTIIRILKNLENEGLVKKVERNIKTGETNGYICVPLEEIGGGFQNANPPLSKCKPHLVKMTTNKEIYKEDYKEIVSKKESKNLKNKKDLQSYEEIFEDFGVGKILKEAYFRFIAHLKVNHDVVMLNDRLQTLIVRLDMCYREDSEKIRALDEAIAKNYKRLECESA